MQILPFQEIIHSLLATSYKRPMHQYIYLLETQSKVLLQLVELEGTILPILAEKPHCMTQICNVHFWRWKHLVLKDAPILRDTFK